MLLKAYRDIVANSYKTSVGRGDFVPGVLISESVIEAVRLYNFRHTEKRISYPKTIKLKKRTVSGA